MDFYNKTWINRYRPINNNPFPNKLPAQIASDNYHINSPPKMTKVSNIATDQVKPPSQKTIKTYLLLLLFFQSNYCNYIGGDSSDQIRANWFEC